jgi:hypothetical protein
MNNQIVIGEKIKPSLLTHKHSKQIKIMDKPIPKVIPSLLDNLTINLSNKGLIC